MKSILNENEKQKLLENFQYSGMTQAAFAVENGISPKTLARWIYQSRLQEKQTKDSVEFVELKRTVITQNQKITKPEWKLRSLLLTWEISFRFLEP